MKTLTIQIIREVLAQDDAENIDEYRDKFQIYMDGCPGYNNIDAETCMDYYINKGYLFDGSLEDETPVDVAQVVDEEGKVLFIVSQCCSELSFRRG
jgi:hypothetical protein